MAPPLDNQPAWMRPENWPDRRPAPGYPRRHNRPIGILWAIAIPAIIASFLLDRQALGFLGIALLVGALWIVSHLTVGRFRCPECGRRLPYKPPRTGQFVQFHCPDCRIIWLTGLQMSDDSAG